MQVDSTGTRLAPRQFNSAIEVAENARRVMAFRQKSWTLQPVQPKIVIAPVPIIATSLPDWPLLNEALPSGDYEIPKIGRPLSETYEPIYDPPSIHSIQVAMCKAAKITMTDICSARKLDQLVVPRQLAIALARLLTSRSLPDLGRRFGGRDHTTVLHAIRKMAPVMDAIRDDAFSLPLDQLATSTLNAWARIKPPTPDKRALARA